MTDNLALGVRLRESDLPLVSRGGGASSTRLVRRSIGAKTILNGITDIPPGGAIPLHNHNCGESVLVLSGDGIAVMGNDALQVISEAVFCILPELPHQFKNSSDQDALRIFWTYVCFMATRTMAKTGETHSIYSEHSN
jgi:quercetin dioxygenase-like cupin family protein